MKLFFILLGFLSAHQQKHKDSAKMESQVPISEAAILEIKKSYDQEIAPIFKNKCFDCHGSTTHYPWYYKLPGIKQWIDNDIEEAKEHLDFSEGYPFKSHSTPTQDLEELKETTVDSNEMPPWTYRLMHPKTKLTAEEKSKVRQWIQNSQITINERAKPN